jgi:hypothetical protein
MLFNFKTTQAGAQGDKNTKLEREGLVKLAEMV